MFCIAMLCCENYAGLPFNGHSLIGPFRTSGKAYEHAAKMLVEAGFISEIDGAYRVGDEFVSSAEMAVDAWVKGCEPIEYFHVYSLRAPY